MFPFLGLGAAVAAAQIAIREMNYANEEELRQQRRREDLAAREFLNPFDTMSDANFKQTFRLSKALAERIYEEISPLLADEGETSTIPKKVQLLNALHFYGSGSYQRCIADLAFR